MLEFSLKLKLVLRNGMIISHQNIKVVMIFYAPIQKRGFYHHHKQWQRQHHQFLYQRW